MKIKKYYSLFKENRSAFFLMMWLTIMPVVSSSFLTLFIINNEQLIDSFNYWHWMVFAIVAFFTMAFAITPTTFIALVCGYFLGLSGCVLVVGSYQIASLIGYYTSQFANRTLVSDLVTKNSKAAAIIENVNQNQFKVVVLSRLSPALPFALMNVVLAMSSIRIANFFLGGLLGMLPRTLFFVWVGSQAVYLKEALTQNEGLGWIIGVTLFVFVIFYFLLRPVRQNTP